MYTARSHKVFSLTHIQTFLAAGVLCLLSVASLAESTVAKPIPAVQISQTEHSTKINGKQVQ